MEMRIGRRHFLKIKPIQGRNKVNTWGHPLFVALIALVAGAALLYGSFCTDQLAATNVGFVLKSRLMDPWATAWVWRGNAARLVELDTPKAIADYREAIRRDPLLLSAWFALAHLESQTGNRRESRILYQFLTQRLPDATPWQWQQLLLAYDHQDQQYFKRTFNLVIKRLPSQRQEALELAYRFWGTWDQVISNVAAENRIEVLHLLMRRRETEAALSLYGLIKAVPEEERIQFVDYLIRNKAITDAVRISKAAIPKDAPLITNGSFESALLNKAFGWHIGRCRGVEVQQSKQGAYDGKTAMRFHFLGTHNIRYNHFWQPVPVVAGNTYKIQFARRAQRITTDQGVYLEVRGFQCRGLHEKSRKITGTLPWEVESFKFRVPDDCKVVRVGIRRDESLKFDNKISGDYWIDAVELVQVQESG